MDCTTPGYLFTPSIARHIYICIITLEYMLNDYYATATCAHIIIVKS